MRLFTIFTLLLALSAQAATETESIGNWSIGAHIGYGQRSAFITGQDDVNIYVLPDIRYYGEQLFFDNGTLGYTFHDKGEFAFSFIGELNPYGLYFEQSAFGESFNSLYLVSQGERNEETFGTSNDGVETFFPTPPTTDTGVADQLPPAIGSSDPVSYNWPKPSVSIDAGLLTNWFISDRQSIAVKWVTDVSNKHSGLRAKFNWSVNGQIGAIHWQSSLGFDYLDSKASNYYFGLTPNSPELADTEYQLSSAINPFASITANYRLTDSINFVTHVKYLSLDSQIADSPITNSSHTVTYFAGFHYKFW